MSGPGQGHRLPDSYCSPLWGTLVAPNEMQYFPLLECLQFPQYVCLSLELFMFSTINYMLVELLLGVHNGNPTYIFRNIQAKRMDFKEKKIELRNRTLWDVCLTSDSAVFSCLSTEQLYLSGRSSLDFHILQLQLPKRD